MGLTNGTTRTKLVRQYNFIHFLQMCLNLRKCNVVEIFSLPCETWYQTLELDFVALPPHPQGNSNVLVFMFYSTPIEWLYFKELPLCIKETNLGLICNVQYSMRLNIHFKPSSILSCSFSWVLVASSETADHLKQNVLISFVVIFLGVVHLPNGAAV